MEKTNANGGIVTIGGSLYHAARSFAELGLPSPMLDAEVLLAHVLCVDRPYLYRNPEAILAPEAFLAFAALQEKRLQHEPVAYLRGQKEFWSLAFEVNERVLIPRPDTECLVEEVIDFLGKMSDRSLRILDLGTGSGAIAVALAKELPAAHVTATDISADAVEIAQRNAKRHGVDLRLNFAVGHLFEPVSGKYDIIISNPPYISAAQYATLPAGVRHYEPESALLAGDKGTEFHEKIIAGCAEYLNETGGLFLEIGADQRKSVAAMLAAAGIFEDIRCRLDYAGFDRVISAKRKKNPWTK